MNTYKVWIQIEEIDDSKDHYLNIGEPYEVDKFNTEIEAKRFVENELLEVIPKPLNFALSVLKTRFYIGFGIGSSN